MTRERLREVQDYDDIEAEVSAFDEVENALRGQWTMNCEKGKLQVAITLAPTMPPRVQFLSVRPAASDSPRSDACR